MKAITEVAADDDIVNGHILIIVNVGETLTCSIISQQGVGCYHFVVISLPWQYRADYRFDADFVRHFTHKSYVPLDNIDVAGVGVPADIVRTGKDDNGLGILIDDILLETIQHFPSFLSRDTFSQKVV